MIFASIEKLGFKKSTRKDDLVSLGYMLLFLAYNQELPYSAHFMEDKDQRCIDPIKNLETMLLFKNTFSLTLMAEKTGIE
jgi:hypothetical protein